MHFCFYTLFRLSLLFHTFFCLTYFKCCVAFTSINCLTKQSYKFAEKNFEFKDTVELSLMSHFFDAFNFGQIENQLQ